MMRFAPRGIGRLAMFATVLSFAAPAYAVPSVDSDDLSSLSGTYLAARTADVEKDVVNAARFYRDALRSDPDNLYLLERAMVLTASSGDVAEAVGYARTLQAKQPASHSARLVLAVEDIRTGKYDAALKALDDRDAGVLGALTNGLAAAWARFGEGEVDAALSGLDALKGETWYEPFKLLHGGYIALAAGRTEEALKDLTQARARDGNAIRITEAYARALAVAGKTQEAEDALTDFLARFPDNPLAQKALDDVHAGRAHEDLVAKPVEGTAEALAGIGAAIGQEGGTEVAFLYLRLALYLDPNVAGGLAAVSLGSLLDKSNQGEAAIAAYAMVPKDAPFHGLARLRTALALDGMDRTKEAEEAFKDAIASHPDDVENYISYGNMLRGRERFAEAAEVYTQAIDHIPHPAAADWSIFYFRGIAYERTNQWPKAEADFKKALELSPDQPLVLNYLGYSWVDKGINLDQAIAMIKNAVDLRPNDGYIVDSLGWAHYRLGDYDQAVEELERAISLKPDDPVINDHLGDAYWKAGRKLEAQFQWRHARDFGAEGPELELILKKIAEERLIEATTQKSDASDVYTVKPGDSLSTITAELHLRGDAVQKFLDVNKDKLRNPDRIRPGLQLVIPSAI